MDRYRIHQLVTELVDDSPNQAAEILTRCCEQQDKVLQDVISYILQSRPKQTEAPTPSANRLNIICPPLPPSSHGSHYTGTPPPRQRTPRRFSSTTYPLSPPGTASSVTSHSSRGDSGSGEYILLPTLLKSGIVDQKVRMKSAPIRHSVIRDNVVHERNLNDTTNMRPAQVNQVDVPYRTFGGYQLISVSWSIELTWRRPHSDSTHNTLFYVVPRDLLNMDILLGCEDSGEGVPDYQPTIVPDSKARQNPFPQEYKQGMHSPVPTPPSPSFHRSAMTHDGSGSVRASPVHRQDEQYHAHHLVEPFISRQHSYRTTMENHQPSPAPTVLDSHIEHPQPLRPNIAPTTPIREADPNKTTDKIRLCLLWDVATVNVWLDLNAHDEAFFGAFQQQGVKQRKNILDRAMMAIHLKRDKYVPNDEAYALGLDEDDLDADWETTIEWLKANKRDKPPHFYGTVQFE